MEQNFLMRKELADPNLAVLLAAGRGKRLRPWTDTTPKPLLPVEGRATLDYTLEAVKRAGIQQVIFIVGHLGDQIVNYVGDGSNWGIEPYFCEQVELLGTAHALKQAVADLEEGVLHFSTSSVMCFQGWLSSSSGYHPLTSGRWK